MAQGAGATPSNRGRVRVFAVVGFSTFQRLVGGALFGTAEVASASSGVIGNEIFWVLELQFAGR